MEARVGSFGSHRMTDKGGETGKMLRFRPRWQIFKIVVSVLYQVR